MKPGGYLVGRALHGLALLLGVTFLSFLLMVEFGPDPVFEQLGRNPSAEQIEEVRRALGQDRPLLLRYGQWLGNLGSGDLGLSDSSGEPVLTLLQRTLPVTILLVLPGFILGNLLGMGLAMIAAWRRGSLWDRLVLGGSVAGLSLSFLVIIIALQILLCTPYGLNLFPARGWRVDGLTSYLYYVTVPTLSLVFISLGYNTRFYRAVFVEELSKDYIRTVRAFGAGPGEVLFRHVLRNSAVAVLTRLLYSIPLVLVSGSLLLETYFGIPGIGRVAFDAITSGDQPVLLAVVTLTAVLFVIIQWLTEFFCRLADPRIGST